jgi:hypothetical protein
LVYGEKRNRPKTADRPETAALTPLAGLARNVPIGPNANRAILGALKPKSPH